MKKLTLKALIISAVAAFSMSAQAASTYDMCLSDASTLIQTAKDKGITAAKALKQKTTVDQCFTALNAIEAKYGKKTLDKNPTYVMTPADRVKWSKLFSAIDAKQYQGVRFLQAAYYR